jgi:hypothetical protein
MLEPEHDLQKVINVSLKIISFLNYYEKKPFIEPENPLKSGDIKDFFDDWYVDFITSFDNKTYFAITNASYFLGIKSLKILCLVFLVTESRGKTRDEVIKRWDLVISREEEMQILRDNPWILDVD